MPNQPIPESNQTNINYADPRIFVGFQGRVYAYGPSWISEIGMLRENESLGDFMWSFYDPLD